MSRLMKHNLRCPLLALVQTRASLRANENSETACKGQQQVNALEEEVLNAT